MRDSLSVGVVCGLMTAAWCVYTGGSAPLALLAYSTAGTLGVFTSAIFLALASDGTDLDL